MKPAVIGITGQPGAGKDTLAEMLVAHLKNVGFEAKIVTPGDLIRDYVVEHKLGDPGDRTVLNHAAQKTRDEYGSNYWLQHAIARAKGVDVLVYPGMRHATEVELAHKHDGIIVAIDAARKTRYEWVKHRNRPGD